MAKVCNTTGVYHYRKNYKKYRSFPRAEVCSLCEDDLAGRSILTTEHAFVLPNRVAYDLWELRNVTEHLMLVPRKHVTKLAELNETARLDIMQILADYEARGYNIYARGVGNTQRSEHHQHTHLIKTEQKKARGSLALQKPYLFVKF